MYCKFLICMYNEGSILQHRFYTLFYKIGQEQVLLKPKKHHKVRLKVRNHQKIKYNKFSVKRNLCKYYTESFSSPCKSIDIEGRFYKAEYSQ